MFVSISVFDKPVGKIYRDDDGTLKADAKSEKAKTILEGFIEDYEIMDGGEDENKSWDISKTIETSSNEWFNHLPEHLPDGVEASDVEVDTGDDDGEFERLTQDMDDFKERMKLNKRADTYKAYMKSKYEGTEQ